MRLPDHSVYRVRDGGPRGVSLPELMAVLAIVMVVGNLAIGHFARPGRATIAAGVARDAYTRLIHARTAAVTGGAQVQVSLFPGDLDRVLHLRAATEPGLQPDPPLGAPMEVVGARRLLRVTSVAAQADAAGAPPPPLPAGEVRLVFFPDGRAQLAGVPPHPGVTIYLNDELERSPYRLTILGRTGFVRLVDR